MVLVSPAMLAAGGAGLGAMVGGVEGSKASKEQLKEARRQQAWGRERIGSRGEHMHEAIQRQRGAFQQYGDQALGSLGTGYEQAQGYLLPGFSYAQGGYQAGMGALHAGQAAGLADLYGGLGAAHGTLGQAGQQFAALQGGIDVTQDPGYQFRLQQGEEAIQRAASASGGRMGGATLQALQEHAQGLASQEYGAAFERQMGLAGAQAGLASQQAAMQYGAGGQALGARLGVAGQEAGLSQALAEQQLGLLGQKAGYAAQYGQQQAAMQMGIGGAVAGTYGAEADMQMGLLQSELGLTGLTVPYAGGAHAAWANVGQQAMSGTLALTGQGIQAGAQAYGGGA